MENQSESPYLPGLTGEKTVSPTTSIALPMREILRIREHHDYGTFGVMSDLDKNIPIHTTLERVWKNNESFVSCIPEGEYLCKRYSSKAYPDTFEITGVRGRTVCLFHQGNIDDHSEGCVLLGESFDPVWNKKAGKWDYGQLQSSAAFLQFMNSLKGVDQWKLMIRRYKP